MADGYAVTNPIEYKGEAGNLNFTYFTEGSSVSKTLAISKGGLIRTNEELAAIRGFQAAQIISKGLGIKSMDKIKIIAKTSSSKGGSWRGVHIKIDSPRATENFILSLTNKSLTAYKEIYLFKHK